MTSEIQIVKSFFLDEGQLQIVEDMGASNFSGEQIAKYLDLNQDTNAFLIEFQNVDSEIYVRYHKGLLQTQFEINQKLAKSASAGNITAMQQFEKHKENIKVENLKQKYFG